MSLSDLSRTELLDLVREHCGDEAAARGPGKEDAIKLLEDAGVEGP